MARMMRQWWIMRCRNGAQGRSVEVHRAAQQIERNRLDLRCWAICCAKPDRNLDPREKLVYLLLPTI
jgi:hypothetical protein